MPLNIIPVVESKIIAFGDPQLISSQVVATSIFQHDPILFYWFSLDPATKVGQSSTQIYVPPNFTNIRLYLNSQQTIPVMVSPVEVVAQRIGTSPWIK